MKKQIVIVIVVLFALILVLRYMEKKTVPKRAQKVSEPAGEKAESGRPLPEEAKKTALDIKVPEQTYDIGTGMALSDGGRYKKHCEEGSVEEIISYRGRIWGVDKPTSETMTDKESMKIYGLLTEYGLCKAAAFRSPGFCSSLPVVEGDAEKKFIPREECERLEKFVAFAGYAAGRSDDVGACGRFMTLFPPGSPEIPEDKFCEEAARGLEGICEAALGRNEIKKAYIPPEMKEECLATFPVKLADCKGKKTCVFTYNFYRAFKRNDCSALQGAEKEICKAYLAKSQTPCYNIAGNLSKTYCGFLSNIDKAEGDVSRMSAEERREYFREQDRLRKQKELAKKEEEEILKKVNERVRKVLGEELKEIEEEDEEEK